MNTQTNTQNTYTVEEVATMLLALSGRVDNIEAQLSKKSLKKTAKPKRSAEEIEADKMRKQAAKAEKKLKAEKLKAEKKLAAEKLKAEKLAAKQAKKLEDEKLKVEKKLKAEQAKAKKKLEAEKAKAEKLAAKQAKKLAKGPSLKDCTKKPFNLYSDLKPTDDDNRFKGLNGSTLRIARKKDGSDTTVYRVMPENWTEEAIKHFDSLEDKWNRKGLPFSPDYVAPEPKIKSAKKKATKKKKAAKKTLVEQTVVDDTDDELEEQPPAEYSVHRCFRMSEKSSEITWIQYSGDDAMKSMIKARGLVPLNQWAYMRFSGDDQFNDKIYEANPLAPKVGKNIVKDGKVVGNCCESFNPLTEDNKDAETVAQADDEEELDEIEDDDEELIPDTLDWVANEYDSDGYRDFSHWNYDGETLKITKDNRVFKADGMTFLGRYNEDTTAITNESSSEEEDAFGSENDMVDGEVF